MIKYEEFELSNGLKVLVHEDKTTPIATLNILYDVGSKDEDKDKTGFAHLFEHFMFEGSANIKAFDEEMQKAGGDNNAFTTNDFTNYYATLPASNIETAFWLESDRMYGLDFNQESLDTQISVVSEEFKETCINKPYGDMWHLISDMAYKKSPYKWPTIGYSLDHIEAITMQDTRDFFYKYYRPNNAVLTIAGGVKTKEMERLAEKWFGDIAPGAALQRNLPTEDQQTATRRKTVTADVPVDIIFIGFHVGSRLSLDYYATDLLSDVLGSGSSSRLYKELVKEKKLFGSISCYLSGSDDEGLILVEAKLNEGISMEAAENGIFSSLNKIQLDKIPEYELEKVKNKTLNYLAFSNISNVNKSFNMAYFKKMGHLYLVNEEQMHFKMVTTKQIQQAAQNYLNIENSSILYYKSKKNK